MSTPTPSLAPALTTAPPTGAAAYVTAVRTALDDLAPDVVEELTGGLEADLADQAAESDTPLAQRLGDPAAYAAELRSAAGLAPRSAPRPAGVRAAVRLDLARAWHRAVDPVTTSPRWPAVRDFALTLRPVWWVARAGVALWLCAAVTGHASAVRPDSAEAWLGLGLLTWASVQVGRGRWTWSWVRPAVVAANAVAVVLLPVALSDSAGEHVVYVDSGSSEAVPPASGLYVDGRVVSNIYPYDAQGRPLTGVQLLDDYGQPLQVGPDNRTDWSTGAGRPLVPYVSAEGQVVWNAYPLQLGSTDGSGAPTEVQRPEEVLPALVAPAAAAQTTPTAAPTAPPSAPVAPMTPAPSAS